MIFLLLTLMVATTNSQVPLIKRPPLTAGVKWTFDFAGIPNDPMVSIDTEMSDQTSETAAASVDTIIQDFWNLQDKTKEDGTTGQEEAAALAELLAGAQGIQVMSMPTTVPSVSKSPSASLQPSVTSFPSMAPSSGPSLTQMTPTLPSTSNNPSSSPSVLPSISPLPLVTFSPSQSSAPSGEPSSATSSPSANLPVNPTIAPVVATTGPTVMTQSPTASPSMNPNMAPTPAPTSSSSGFTIPTAPVIAPTPSPTPPTTTGATESPSFAFPSTVSPTIPCGITPEQRANQIMAQLDLVGDSVALRQPNTFQSLAALWLIDEDQKFLCPNDPLIVQRWALAVTYFATSGDSWFQCGRMSSDNCGLEVPFIGEERFMSEFCECDWAGIMCNSDMVVTEIEFEDNNLVGTIPTEVGLFSLLERWGMERGGLTGRIPTEIGLLTHLNFLDLDYNQLTGSLSPELLSLSNLEQLDLNDNEMTGRIEGITGFPNMSFMQLHDNNFFGTVPTEVGSFRNLTAFTVHETNVSGEMPESICNLVSTGLLESLIADCTAPEIICDCCTDCRLDV